MAELVGISPTQITKEARTELVGDIVENAMAGALPKMARTRTNPEIQASRPKHLDSTTENPRAKTPEHSPREAAQKSRIKNLEETKAKVRRDIELLRAGYAKNLLSVPDNRPTRSTYKAPDIPPLPSVPLERQKRKDPKDQNQSEVKPKDTDREKYFELD